jgi:Tol biopolymer transport system component
MFVSATPSLSSDGQYLAYATPCTGQGDIYVLKSSTNTPSQLTIDDDFESSPVFTVDDKRIVYVREHDQRRHIWIMNADGSEQTQLTTGSVIDDPMALSQDGRYLIFNRGKPSFGQGIQARACVMQIDRPDAPLINVGNYAIFSPDSKFVVYTEQEKLYRLALNENKNLRLELGVRGYPQEISQDGKWLLATRLRDGPDAYLRYDIWALNIDNGTEVHLGKGVSAAFLGTDSDKVLFFLDQQPYVTSARGGTPTRIGSDSHSKTSPRPMWGGRGAIVASFQDTRPDYNVLFIDSEGEHVDTIASLRCNGASFRSPFSEKPTNITGTKVENAQ